MNSMSSMPSNMAVCTMPKYKDHFMEPFGYAPYLNMRESIGQQVHVRPQLHISCKGAALNASDIT
jgi:hypothetical protein